MGVRGPIPERTDQVVRRNTPDIPVTKIAAKGPVKVPELDLDDPHPIVKALYESLAASAQATYYEPSDWQYARLTLHFADKLLKKSDPSAVMLATVNQMLSSLLVSEGDRRRVRIEVERNQTQNGPQVVDIAEMFRQKLQGSRTTS